MATIEMATHKPTAVAQAVRKYFYVNLLIMIINESLKDALLKCIDNYDM